MNRTIRQIDTPQTHFGDGQTIAKRMVLEPGNWAATDPFLFLAEDWFRQPGGFPDHPHRGIETVTLVLDGELRHADNRGNSGILKTDDVQWMTAGRGIIHAELPHEDSTVHSLQLWLNLPSTKKMVEASYQDLPAARALIADDDWARIRVISGEVGAVRASVQNQVPILYLDVALDTPGRTALPIPAGHNGFIYMLSGAAQFGGELTKGAEGQVLWLDYPTVESGISTLEVESEVPARFLLIAGPPIREPVVAYGPFVMNTRDEIRQAYVDYQAGLFGGPTPAAQE